MGFHAGFPLAEESPVSVDPSVGSFDNPSSGLDFEPGLVFRPGHDVDIDTCCGGEFAGSWALVALVGSGLLQVGAVSLPGEEDSHRPWIPLGSDIRSTMRRIVGAP